ncbi:MAG: molybdate ABC transporter substrate-binding protein, partial [Caulobacterales bacterium]|nr:molybdate ABC transporter substrate-binding protein [Caulobacterales bacterium]
NFKTAAEALEAAFEARSDHRIALTSGSTGKLYAQIVNGAPFDVFLAADQERPRLLEEDGRAVAGSRVTYAVGRLVLWDPSGSAAGPERLARGAYRRLAIAQPDLAPYGAAAQQTLAALGLDAPTRPKRVFGESIGQAFAFVHTGNAELGFVALSQVLSLSPSRRGRWWEPPADLHNPIRQDGVLLARASENPAAQAFLAFLSGEAAAAVITGAGYALP